MARDIRIFNLTNYDSSVEGYVVEIGISISGSQPRSMSGLELLLHKWLVIFLSEPMSDPMDLDSGGGVLQEIGQNTDTKTLTDFRAKSERARSKTDQELFLSQIDDDIEDEQERLFGSTLISVSKDGEDGFNITIQIVNEARISANLIIPMTV